MPGESNRQYAVALVVVGIIVVVLGAFLVVAWAVGGDDTDEVDPQNAPALAMLTQ